MYFTMDREGRLKRRAYRRLLDVVRDDEIADDILACIGDRPTLPEIRALAAEVTRIARADAEGKEA